MITQRVLDLFIDKSNFRQAITLPFKINNRIYATDAYTLIRIDKDNCDVVIENPHTPPDCEAVIPTQNMSLKLDLSEVDFEKYLTEDEFIVVGEDVICDECDGDGTVEWGYKEWTMDDECPRCKGAGIIDEAKKVKTGRKTFGNQVVQILSTHLDIHRFYKLVEVQKIIGGDIFLIGYSVSKLLFSIGECEILIMANLDDSDKEVIKIKFE